MIARAQALKSEGVTASRASTIPGVDFFIERECSNITHAICQRRVRFSSQSCQPPRPRATSLCVFGADCFTYFVGMKAIVSSLEILEPHRARLGVALHRHDGDKVTITSSAGDLTGWAPSTPAAISSNCSTSPDATFDHANLTFSVLKVAGGDGLANVSSMVAPMTSAASSSKRSRPDRRGQRQRHRAGDQVAQRSQHGPAAPIRRPPAAQPAKRHRRRRSGSLKVTGDVKDAFIDVFGATTATTRFGQHRRLAHRRLGRQLREDFQHRQHGRGQDRCGVQNGGDRFGESSPAAG